MKILVGILVVGLFSYYALGWNENPLKGEWRADGNKIVESMIQSGKLKDDARAKQLVTVFSDATYSFTDTTLGISFESEPNLKQPPISYEITETTGSSITISFLGKGNKHIQEKYHFNDDGSCIYVKRDRYNDYFCK